MRALYQRLFADYIIFSTVHDIFSFPDGWWLCWLLVLSSAVGLPPPLSSPPLDRIGGQYLITFLGRPDVSPFQ